MDPLSLSPAILGALMLKKPELFRPKRWTEDSSIVIRVTGVALVILGFALFFAVR